MVQLQKGVLMTDGWGNRAIPEHKLIPPLHKQRQGIVGFADSQKRDSPPSVLCDQGNAASTNRDLGEGCGFAGNY